MAAVRRGVKRGPLPRPEGRPAFGGRVHHRSDSARPGALPLVVTRGTVTAAAVRNAEPMGTRSAITAGIVGLLTVWVAVLGHECAHFASAKLAYSPAGLATGRVPTGAHIVTVAAGPIFTPLTVVASVLVIPRMRTWRARLVVSTVVGAAAGRLLLMAPPTLLGRGGNDERTLGLLTGISPPLLWVMEAIIVAWSIVAVAKTLPMSERRRTLSWIVLTQVVGWATAIPLGRAVGLPI